MATYNPSANKISADDLSRLLQHSDTILGGDLNTKHPGWDSRVVSPSGPALWRFATSYRYLAVWGLENATFFPHNPKMRGDVLGIFVFHGKDINLEVRTAHELSSDHFPVLAVLGSELLPAEQILGQVCLDSSVY